MKAFGWTLVILMAVSALGKLMHLTREHGDRDVPRWSDALDVVMNTALIAWGCVILL